jgi:hypothetical protein
MLRVHEKVGVVSHSLLPGRLYVLACPGHPRCNCSVLLTDHTMRICTAASSASDTAS